MIMKPGLRKLSLACHLTLAVGWIGAVVAYLAIGIAAETSKDVQTVRGAWTAMELIGWYVIVPMAVGSLLSGIVMAVGTKWGLFRHYWVSISLVLTAFSAAILLQHMPTVSSKARIARQAGDGEVLGLGGDLAHPGIGLVVLLVIQVLNVYKPRGVTRYGCRKRQDQRTLQR